MFRKLLAALIAVVLVAAVSPRLFAADSYVQLYNYTECDLTLYVDGANCGTIPPCYSPSWAPVPYGLHKIEVYKADGWHSTSKYCETSYSYPNATVSFGKSDI